MTDSIAAPTLPWTRLQGGPHAAMRSRRAHLRKRHQDQQRPDARPRHRRRLIPPRMELCDQTEATDAHVAVIV